MKAFQNKSNIFYIILLMLPLILSVIFYNSYPDMVAVHWDSQGIADHFVSRNAAAFGLPIIEFAVILIFNISRKGFYIHNKNLMYYIGKWGIAIIPFIVQTAILLMTKNEDANISINTAIVLSLLFGIALIVIGVFISHSKIDF